MALADAQKTADMVKTVAHQADFAAVGFLALVKALVANKTIDDATAGSVLTEALSMSSPAQRNGILPAIKQFLPGYQPPRFSAFGPGVAVDLDQLEAARKAAANPDENQS